MPIMGGIWRILPHGEHMTDDQYVPISCHTCDYWQSTALMPDGQCVVPVGMDCPDGQP